MPLKVKLGTRVLPFEDLLMSDTASPFLTLGDGEDIELVLAVMAGLGPTMPKMLQLDANGKLLMGNPGGSIGSVIIGSGLGQGGAFVVFPNDAQTFAGAIALWAMSSGMVFNGASWDRARSASATNLVAKSGLGAAIVAPPGTWFDVSTPAAGVLASATQGAGAAGVRHICSGIIVTFGAIAAPVATSLQWNLRDGVSGAGTILASGQIAVPAAAFQGQPVYLTDLSIPGTPATAMTLEFSAALANLLEGVTLLGFDAS